MIEPANPYEPPASQTNASSQLSRIRSRYIFKTSILGCVIGANMAAGACCILSGGNAAWWFHLRWGVMGAIVGLFCAASCESIAPDHSLSQKIVRNGTPHLRLGNSICVLRTSKNREQSPTKIKTSLDNLSTDTPILITFENPQHVGAQARLLFSSATNYRSTVIFVVPGNRNPSSPMAPWTTLLCGILLALPMLYLYLLAKHSAQRIAR